MRRLLFMGLLCFMSFGTFAKVEKDAALSTMSQLHFIENKGQITDQFHHSRNDIQFSLPNKGVNVFVGNGQLHYQFSKVNNADALAQKAALLNFKNIKNLSKKDTANIDMYRMDVSLIGSNKDAKVIAAQQQPLVSSYYLPQCGEKGAKAYAYNKITYKDVYPNIDWVIYIKDNQVEYDFVIGKGGNPADIKLQYDGASALSINKDGSLTATTPMGSISEKTPISLSANGKKVNTSFVLNRNVLSFKVAPFTAPLTIDPSISWATYYGGTGVEQANFVKGDATGNIYICGTTESFANIATTGAYQTTYNGGDTYYGDAFVAKFNSSGAIQWATYFGGEDDDMATSMDIDSVNNIYVVGLTASATNIATIGAYQFYNGGSYDGLLAKFNSAGSLEWGTYYGGDGIDVIDGVRTDKAGNTYVTGYSGSTTGISTSGTYLTTMNGDVDAFVAKFNNTGNLSWGTYYGNNNETYGEGIAIDNSGNINISGYTSSTEGISSNGAYQTAYGNGTYNGFLAQFNNAGTTLQWGTYYGGTGQDMFGNVCTDATGNIFAVGLASSTGLASTGAYQTSFSGGNYDAILAKFNNTGTRQWATYLGGSGDDESQGIDIDVSGNVIIGGITSSTSGIANANGFQQSLAGTDNGFLTKFSTTGVLAWSSYFGGTGDDNFSSVYCDTSNHIYALGTFTSGALATTGAYQTINNGDGDALLVKIADCAGPAQPGAITGSTTVCGGSTQTYYTTPVAGATSYTWILPNGWTDTSTTDTLVTVAGGTSGTISVAAVDACGAGTPQTLAVTNTATTAVIAATGSTAICSGSYVVLNTTTTGTGYTYQWQLNGTAISGATGTSYTATQAGSYTLANTNTAGCLGSSNTISVTTAAAPTNTITPYGSTTFCQGFYNYVELEASYNYNYNYTYQWQLNGVDIPNAINDYYDASAGGSYTVVMSQTGGCTDTSAPVSITVDPQPTQPGTITGSTTVCGGSSQIYSIAPVAGASYYTWTLPSGWSGTSTTTSITTVTGGTSGAISVVANNSCGSSLPQTLTVANTAVTATITAAGATAFCQGGSVVLNDATTDATFTYQWQSNGIDISGATTTTYTASESGSYTMAITNSGGCIGSSNAITVTSSAPPTNVITTYGGTTTLCTGSYNDLELEAPYNYNYNYTYQWQLNGVNIPYADEDYYDVSSSGGSYTVVMAVSGGCSDTSAPVVITVKPSPATPVVSNNGPICAGGILALTATNITAGTTFIWTGDNGYVSTVQDPVISNVQYGNDYTLTVTDTDGCVATASTYPVINEAPYSYEIEGSYSVCPGSQQEYQTYGQSPADTYTWTLPSGWSGTSTTEYIEVVAGGIGGTISVTETNNCGTSQPTTLTVSTLQAPNVTITQNGAILEAPNNLYSYQWYFNGTAIPGAYGSSYAPTQSGSYYVMTSSGSGSCVGQSNTIDIALGVPNIQSGLQSVSLYPNPNNGSFTLTGTITSSASNVTIEVVDVTGRVILKDETTIVNSLINKQINMGNDIAAGMYMVKLTSNSVLTVIPFVKK